MTFEQTLFALRMIVEYYPHSFSVTEEGSQLWHLELGMYEAEDVYAAIRMLSRSKDAFPSLKDILDRLEPPALGAADAWRAVTSWADKSTSGTLYRAGNTVEPEALPADLAAAAAVIGDARTIAARTSNEEVAMRAHFFRAWEEQAKRRRDASHREAITGGKAPRSIAGPSRAGDLFGAVLPPGGAA